MKNPLFKLFLIITALFFISSCQEQESQNTDEKNSQLDLSIIETGKSIKYQETEYLITKNTFTDTSTKTEPSLSRAVTVSEFELVQETTEQIEKNKSYIDTYLNKEFQEQLIKDELKIDEYIEIFEKNRKSNKTTGGQAELQDIYLLLDKTGKKLAKFSLRWNSDMLYTYLNKSLTQEEKREAFLNLGEDNIRTYDPSVITMENFPDDIKQKFTLSIRYNYYSDAFTCDPDDSHYRKLNLDDYYYRNKTCNYINTANGVKGLYKENIYSDGKIKYTLLDPVSNSNIIELQSDKTFCKLDVFGIGNVNGSTSKTDWYNRVTLNYNSTEPVNAKLDIGESTSTHRENSTIKSVKYGESYSNDFTDSLRLIYKYTDDGGSSWTNTKNQTIDNISSLPEYTDYLSFADTKTDINEISVPSYIKINTHYQKQEDSSYPVFDKYASVICYPVFDDELNRITYKLTEKSIKDFISVYRDDFLTLSESYN